MTAVTGIDVPDADPDENGETGQPASWRIERLMPTFAAHVHDIDLREVVAAQQGRAVRELLVTHKVLFFSDQHLDLDTQVALGRQMGEVTVSHPVVSGATPTHPEVYALDSYDGGRSDVWHTDVTFMPRPPMASILRPVAIPEVGGNTNWVDLEAAYASLSPAVRRLAEQ